MQHVGGRRPGGWREVQRVLWRVTACGMLLLQLSACGRPLVRNRLTATRAPAAATVVPTVNASGDASPSSAATVFPSSTGSDIPNAAPTAPLPEGPTATISGSVAIVPATRQAVSNNDRWRQQQRNRQVFTPSRLYTTTGSELKWYDPVFQQHLTLGTFRGDFEVLATFELPSGEQAIEVLYQVNRRYGLTALSPAITSRIEAAGYSDGFVDTYVLLTDNVQPKT